MMFLIALYVAMFSLLASTEALVGSAFSMVRRDGDSVPLCAIDQPSAITSTISVIWCGIECITSSSSTCHSFSYFETIKECDMFFFAPTNYAVEDGCVTYGVIGPAAEVHANVPTSTAQPVNVPSTTANAIEVSTADSTAASAIAASAVNTISTAGPPVAASATPTANSPDKISTQQATAANTIPAVGPTTVTPAAPTPNIPGVISTQQTPAPITTAGPISQAVQTTTPTTTTTTVAPPLTIAPTPTPPTGTLKCEQKIPKSSRRLLQQNTGNGLDQTWSAYKYGFNDQAGGYWIGNEILHRMTNNGTTCRLCMDMQETGMSGSWYYASYTSFVIGRESDRYSYTVSGFAGDVGDDTFTMSNGFNFSAKDTNTQPCTNFASSLKGGWWYPCSATQIILNGVASPPTPPGFYWTTTPMNKFFKTSYMWIACP